MQTQVKPQALTEKYRPKTLDGLYGQFEAVMCLREYVETPYPEAFLFEGDTGTGKTSAAMALANELGVDMKWNFHKIESGTADAKAVEEAVNSMRYSVGQGGYRMILVDEADTMTSKAKEMFLSVLEEIPGRNVIVFTTNHAERMPRRFLDRCMRIKFSSDPIMLRQDAEALLAEIWTAEGMPGQPFAIQDNPDVIVDGALSFRRVVQAVKSARYTRPVVRPVTIPLPDSTPKPMAAKLAKSLPGQAKLVPSGYKAKAGYRLVVAKTFGQSIHELHVNEAGWRFEHIVRTGDNVTLATTHSEVIGARWADQIRELEVSFV